jgi:hypothetical protein
MPLGLAALFLLAHEHQQELEHVQEADVEAERAVDGGLFQPLLIAVHGVGHVIAFDLLRVERGQAGEDRMPIAEIANIIAGDCRKMLMTIATRRPITPMIRNVPMPLRSFFVV